MGYFSAALFASVGVLAYACNVWNSTKGYHGEFIFDEVAVMFALAAIISAGASSYLRMIAGRSLVMGAVALAYIAVDAYVSVSFSTAEVARLIDGSASEALGHNAKIERAEQRLASIKAEASAEAARGGCGPRCRALMEDVEAAQAALDGLGAPMPVDPVGARFQAITQGFITTEAHRTALPVVFAVMIQAGGPLCLFVASLLWGVSAPRRQRVEIITPEPVDPVVRALQVAGGRVGSNNELAEMLRLPAPRVTERVRLLESAGVVTTYREGKNKVIALA